MSAYSFPSFLISHLWAPGTLGSCHQRPSLLDRICFLVVGANGASYFVKVATQFRLFKTVPNRVKGLGLHSEDTGKSTTEFFHRAVTGWISVSAGWRLDGRTACQSVDAGGGLRRLCRSPGRDDRALWAVREERT